MSNPTDGVPLRNAETGALDYVPLDQVKQALASGTHFETDDSKVRQATPGGAVIARGVPQGLNAIQAGGQFTNDADTAATGRDAAYRASFDTVGDKVDTFGEGMADALSFGVSDALINSEYGGDEQYQKGNATRRDVNSGSRFAGELAGTAAGLVAGPGKAVADAGGTIGKAGAKALVRGMEGRLANGVARAAEEAATGAVISGVTSTVHQVADAVINDKPFSAEAVAHEAGLGAILGGAIGGGAGLLSKGGTRAAIAGQGGILNGASAESKLFHSGVDEAIGDYSRWIDKHADQITIGDAIVSEGKGKLSPGMQQVRRAALDEAVAARNELNAIDREGALSANGASHAKYERLQNAYDNYQLKFEALDKAMNLRPDEIRTGTEGLEPVESRWLRERQQLPGEEPGNPDYEPIPKNKPSEAGGVEPRSGGTEVLPGDKVVKAPQNDVSTRVLPKETPAPTPRPPQADLATGILPADAAKPAISAQENAKAFEEALANGKGKPGYREFTPTSQGKGYQYDTGMVDKASAKAASDATDAANTAKSNEIKSNLANQRPIDAFMDRWAQESSERTKLRAGDEMAAKMDRLIGKIQGLSGTTLDAAGTMNPQNLLGLPRSATSLGEKMQQLYTARHVAGMAADASRGIKMPKSLTSKVGEYLKTRMAGGLGAAMLGSVMGGAYGGPVGFMIGASLVQNGAGTIGKVAASAGRLAEKVATTGEKILAGGRSVALSRAVTENMAYQYDDEGPIKDPVKRFQKIQQLAANPEAVRANIQKHLGDLPYIAPEVARGIEDNAIRRMQAISVRLPVFMYDRLGRPQMPAASKMRQGYEFENAMHDLDTILDCAAKGSITQCQADALREGFPEAHLKLTQQILGDPEALAKLPLDKMRPVERILGTRLTSMADPMSVMRHQVNWLQANEAQQSAVSSQGDSQPPNGANGKPQAFKMQTQPTPSQAAATGRAPGNS